MTTPSGRAPGRFSSASFAFLFFVREGPMSTIVRADASGAVTLPAELCRAAGVEPGTDLVAEVQGGRIVLGPTRPTLGERIAAMARALPPEVLDQFPTDGASQHDHYLYGTPKRPE
jgi:antitoxin component of MazEF toxin-antitoxin module